MGHAFTLRLTAPSMKGVNPDIKITLMGDEKNGKSTLLGVLTTG
jgi:GTPase